MLKITSKDFEIDETIQLTKIIDGKEEKIYEFQMQITNDEMQELKHIFFDFAEENMKKYSTSTIEEKQKLEEEVENKIKENDERFEDICFKEHKEKFKEIAGEYKYEETKDTIKGFLVGFFMEKQISQMNTPITSLTKITNNLQKFK